MFERLLAFLQTPEGAKTDANAPDALQRAAAILLVIAARIDGRMDANERAIIQRLLKSRLGVGNPQALIDEAEIEAAAATDFFGATRVIKDELDADQRDTIIEMLWEVVYADGEVHDYEANLVRRVAGLLHVSDRDAGEARKRVTD
jgi:uncharacterized tellurite resistance protein B-like protein